MRCPVCKTMLKVVRGAVEIDVCPLCRGAFLDRGELKAAIDGLLTTGQVPEAPLEMPRPISVYRTREEPRLCPRCTSPMDKFNYCYDSNIILDRCPDCDGIWADRGEVLKCAQYRKGNPALERLGASIAQQQSQQQAWRDAAGIGRRTNFYPWAWYCLPSLLPLGDDTPSERVPVVTVGLLAANVLVFVLMLMWEGGADWQGFYGKYGLVPEKVLAGAQLWGFLTSMFLHSGVFHLTGNMLFLWIFGDNVEDVFGWRRHSQLAPRAVGETRGLSPLPRQARGTVEASEACRWRFLGFYLACGLAAGLAHVVTNAGSDVPCVGASGAISGVLGAYVVFHPRASIRTLIVGFLTEIPAAVYIGIWVAFQVFYAVLYSAIRVEGGVAWFAHIGGFAAGLVLALVWRRRRQLLAT